MHHLHGGGLIVLVLVFAFLLVIVTAERRS